MTRLLAPGGWLLGAVVLLAACNMNVMVDPEGHRCNDLDPCPNGYSCVNFVCQGVNIAGGSSGGSVTGGGVTSGGISGGLAGGQAGGSAGGLVGGGTAGGTPDDGGCSCVRPPPTCMGTIARSFSGGECQVGPCAFAPFDLDCAPGTCSNGVCSLSIAQTGPRLRFAVNAIDLAPGSNGAAVVAVGDRSQVAAWNGTRWSSVPPPSSNLSLKAVNFTSSNQAWIVGEARAAWRWDRLTGAFLPTPAPQVSAGATLIGVDGVNDSMVLVADGQGNWSRWNGSSWSDGGLPTTLASNFAMTSVWMDETQRVRIAGLCTNSSGLRRVCVGYYSSTQLNWFVDTGTDLRGCLSIGPSLDVPATVPMAAEAICGLPGNDSLRHSAQGTFTANAALGLSQGNGIVGITGGPPDAGQRPVWMLTSSSQGVGRLYRVNGTNASPVPSAQLDTFMGDERLSPSESAGVVVAEVDRLRNVNNVFYRRMLPVERTEALDLGVDLVGATSFANELVLVSSIGDLAIQRQGSEVYEFRRAPTGSPQYRLEDVEGRNGTQGILAVGRDGSNAGLIARIGFAGYTRVSSSAPSTTFKSVCRANDSEAFAVGTGGALFSIGATATRETSVTTTSDLNAIDCPVPGEAVACGANSTVLRRTQGAWTTVPFPTPGRTFTSCKLVDGTVWVAGDGVFARLDRRSSSWTLLPPRAGLSHLLVRAPNDVLAVSANSATAFELARFDGTTWSTAGGPYAGSAQGAAQVAGRLVWAGTAGVLVEGR